MTVEDDSHTLSVTLDVGTLALVLLVVVSVCSLATLLFLCVYHRASHQQALHCSGCHRVVALDGVTLPPHLLHAVSPSPRRLPSVAPMPHHAPPAPVVAQHSTPAILSPPNTTRNQEEVNHYGNSATFQRLGMRPQPSRTAIVEEARALELPDPSHDSPAEPQTEVTDLEPLSPRQAQRREALGEDPDFGAKFINDQQTVDRGKLGQVRVLVQPGLSTPATKTPNAARTGVSRKFLAVPGKLSGRMVTPIFPTKRFPDDSRDFPLLEASTLTRTAVTTGDIKDLCETSLAEEVVQSRNNVLVVSPHQDTEPPDQAEVTSHKSTVATPASVESRSHTLTNRNMEQLNDDKDELEGLVNISGTDEVFLAGKEEDVPTMHRERVVSYNYQPCIRKGSVVGHIANQATKSGHGRVKSSPNFGKVPVRHKEPANGLYDQCTSKF